jgi:hypothetical protein
MKFMNKKVVTLVTAAFASVVLTAMVAKQNHNGGQGETEDQKQAKLILKSMSDYLSKQQRMSFNYDTTLEFVTNDGQKLGLASSGKSVLSRGEGIHASRFGGFADIEFFFDGKMVTLLDKETNRYAQVEIQGSLENLIDTLRRDYKKSLPGADLLRTNLYEQLMPVVTDIKDLGSGVIRGKECDHVAVRTAFVDIEFWVAHGDHPYPCRMTVTSKDIKSNPQYTVEVSNFKAGDQAETVNFHFVIPVGAKQVETSELTDFDEDPAIFKVKNQEAFNGTL